MKRFCALSLCSVLCALGTTLAGCADAPSEADVELATTPTPGPDGIASGDPGGPVSATVCATRGDRSCYCSGLGCRRTCNDILTIGAGSSSSGPVIGRFAGFYPGTPGVEIGGGAALADVGLVAVVGLESDIDAGHARIVVRNSRGATLVDRAGLTADVRIRAATQSVTMDFLGGLFDTQTYTFTPAP
jgi:hypothetical protein